MNPFTETAFAFFASAPGTRHLVLQFHREHRDPRERSCKLAGCLNELLTLKLADDPNPLAWLMVGMLEQARMHVNFRQLADRLLRMYEPKMVPRLAPQPSAN